MCEHPTTKWFFPMCSLSEMSPPKCSLYFLMPSFCPFGSTRLNGMSNIFPARLLPRDKLGHPCECKASLYSPPGSDTFCPSLPLNRDDEIPSPPRISVLAQPDALRRMNAQSCAEPQIPCRCDSARLNPRRPPVEQPSPWTHPRPTGTSNHGYPTCHVPSASRPRVIGMETDAPNMLDLTCAGMSSGLREARLNRRGGLMDFVKLACVHLL